MDQDIGLSEFHNKSEQQIKYMMYEDNQLVMDQNTDNNRNNFNLNDQPNEGHLSNHNISKEPFSAPKETE
jgi:hypothetical protein